MGTNTQVGDIVRTTASTYADITITRKCASLICGFVDNDSIFLPLSGVKTETVVIS